jgi:RNA recognition motif-containing protein
VSVTVPSDRDTGRPRGFAFVEMATAEQAAAAIAQFDGRELNGRNLRVNEAAERPARAGGFGGGDSGGRGFGGGGFAPPAPRPRPKGSRRNLRARKRSL